MLSQINFFLCGVALPIALCVLGVFFLFRLRFFYILHPLRTLKVIFHSSGGFRPLCVALAGTLGVGNIVGVCSALIMGGAGAVFWMLVSATLSMGIKYAEAFLSIRHRRGCVNNYYGGAPYYIEDSSPKYGRVLGGIFAVLCIINSLSTGTLVQIGSISELFTSYRWVFGVAISLVVALVVIGGQRRIQAISSILIPIITLSYLAISLFIIFSHPSRLCVAILRIFKEAFSITSACAGCVGYGIAGAIRYGFTRGLLSNEAGCGTATVAHASSSLDAHSQGCLGIFEVFWDTIVLCLVTALVVLIADTGGDNPIELAVSSYGAFLGGFGRAFIVGSCVLLALATVCTQFYYGDKSLKFLTKSRRGLFLYSFIFFFVCVASAIISPKIMWHISDFVVALLALFNLVFLAFLSKEIK